MTAYENILLAEARQTANDIEWNAHVENLWLRAALNAEKKDPDSILRVALAGRPRRAVKHLEARE